MKKIFMLCLVTLSLFADFSRDSSGIVTDKITKLEWQDNEVSAIMNWKSAINYCESLTLGKHSDWRLPNINELNSIIDDTKSSPAVDTVVFHNVIANYYWSSTTMMYNPKYDNPVYALYIDFDNAVDGAYDKSYGNGHYARCVRLGR